MSAIVLDECLYYLKEAERYLSLYTEIDPFEEIFEAYTPETQMKVEQNEKAKTGVMGSLTKACQAVMKMIQNIMDSISDFFARRKLDKEQREAYDAFKAACAKDPTLKNKKVTVKDFSKVNEDYNKILAEAESADKELAKGNAIDTENIMGKISSFCGNVGKGVAVSVGAEAALNMASSSREIAQNMYNSLKKDKALEQQLIDAIGKKETKKFERQVKSLGKRVSLQRQIMRMKGTYSRSVEEAIDHTFDSVWELAGVAKDAVNSLDDVDPDLAVKGNALQRAMGKASYIKNNFGTIKKAGTSDILRRAYGNDTIHGAVKDVVKTKNDMSKDARERYKQEQKAEKQRIRDSKKKKQIHDQSMLDSFMGKHDPNSLSNKTVSNLSRKI